MKDIFSFYTFRGIHICCANYVFSSTSNQCEGKYRKSEYNE